MRNFEKPLQKSLANFESFGKLYFTPKQLFYEFCRNQSSPIGLEAKTAVTFFGLSAIPTMIFAKSKPKNALGLLTASAFALSALAISKQIPRTLSPPIAWNEFQENLLDYLKNNEISGLLKIKKDVKFADKIPDDLTLYGLPKLLICERCEIAQMLRLNQFHLQTPCAVLSLREVSPLSENVQKMLLSAEEPQVFFLHDASSQAFVLIPKLRQILALKAEIPLRPLGLRPVHARHLHLFAQRNVNFSPNTNFAEIDYLDESEKTWLKNGFTAEVSAVSPVRLLRVLRRLILGWEIPTSSFQNILPQKNLGFM